MDDSEFHDSSGSEDFELEVELKQDILEILQYIKWSGSFAAFGPLGDFVDPRIEVPGLGRIHLPQRQGLSRGWQ